MPISFRQLSYFIALVEEGSFGGAAARVHISQPALSMQVRELEYQLSVRLVERLPRGIRLTRAGREVEVRARRILAEMIDLEASARRQGLNRRIHLGVIPTVAPYLLPSALPDLREARGTPDLRLKEAQTAVLLEALDAGQLDAVVIASRPQSGAYTQLVLFEDRFLLAGNAERLAALGSRREALRPVSLDPDQLMLLDEGHCLADQALEVCGLDRRGMRLDLGASSLATLCGLVGEGMGLTFLPEIAVAKEKQAVPDMALVRFAKPEPMRQITIVAREGVGEEAWFLDLARVFGAVGHRMTAALKV
jgi:LysR family transcriptional regulator, hydrogen peroxide-inducible genes activator